MASGKTVRRGIPFPLKEDPDTLAADIGALAKALDNDAETGNVKKHSELPAAKTRGRQWQVTEDTETVNGIYWDTETAWIPVGTKITDANIVEGRALMQTESAPSARGVLAENVAEYESAVISTTRRALMLIQVRPPNTGYAMIFSGGVEVGEAVANDSLVSVPVAAGAKLKVVFHGGTGKGTVIGSTTIL